MQFSKRFFTGILTMTITAGLVFSSNAQFQQEGQQQQRQQQQQPGLQQQQQQTVEVSDDELEKFGKTMNELQVVQTEAQQEMVKVIEDNGMDIQTFNELYSQTAQGQTPEDVSRDEMATFENVTEEVMQIQSETEQKMSRTIEENGLEVDRYQEIFMAVQQNPELQQRLNGMH